MEPQIFVDKLKFNDGYEMTIGHSDIVIFAGANNAGKSQALKDIDTLMSAKSVSGIVVTTLDTDYTGDILSKIDDYKQKDGYYHISNNAYSREEDILNMWKKKDPRFAHEYKNRLDTETRLNISKTSPSFDALNAEPSTPAQRLYVDDKLEKKISELFHEAFNAYLILNIRGGSMIPIHVGQTPKMDVGEDRGSTSYLEKLRPLPLLEAQGDGMRSFAGILFDVFTSTKTVTMIDEPEAFLHPPQARLLGRMLVKNKPNDRQLFISTHSEDFLKGLLDADSDNVKIVRINREGNTNNIKTLNNEDVKSLWKDSILRYSNILSGLFHSKVVICESDTDCRFYQAMLNALYEGQNKVSPDILFTHCGGKERFKAVIPALKALDVKTVVVADFDVLDKEVTFKTICEIMGIGWDNLKSKWKSVYDIVEKQSTQLETEDVKRELQAILDGITTPQLSDDDIEAIKSKLKASSAWSKVKKIGKTYFSGSIRSDLDDLMNSCKEKGFLIVPIGELECFYKSLASNSTHGTKWLNLVMGKNLSNDPELEEARKFVMEIETL